MGKFRHQVGHVDGFLYVAARFRQHFAHFARHVLREVFLALGQNFRRAIENFAALRSRRQPPFFKRIRRRVNRSIRVFRGRRRKHPHQLVGVRRVAILDRLPAPRFHPLPINVVLKNLRHYSRSHALSSDNLLSIFDDLL